MRSAIVTLVTVAAIFAGMAIYLGYRVDLAKAETQAATAKAEKAQNEAKEAKAETDRVKQESMTAASATIDCLSLSRSNAMIINALVDLLWESPQETIDKLRATTKPDALKTDVPLSFKPGDPI